jgi:hypothetical protein
VLVEPTYDMSGAMPRSHRLQLLEATLGCVVVQLDVTIVNIALQHIGVSLVAHACIGGVSKHPWATLTMGCTSLYT